MAICDVDFGEGHSTQRVTAEAHKFGLVPAFALNLSTSDEQGNPWDFSVPGQRRKARRLNRNQRPMLLIGSPMCTAWSVLQQLNIAKLADKIFTECYRSLLSTVAKLGSRTTFPRIIRLGIKLLRLGPFAAFQSDKDGGDASELGTFCSGTDSELLSFRELGDIAAS